MKHAKIFSDFEPKEVVADGANVYDFLGVKTDVRFKKGLSRFAPPVRSELVPKLPSFNEQYFDWVLTLEAVQRASGTFRMIEVGAGWGAWSVAAAVACQQRSEISDIELLAIEADLTHFEWLHRHFRNNGLDPNQHFLIHGAVARGSGKVKFPFIENPSEDYSASPAQVWGDRAYIEVDSYNIQKLVDSLSGPVDFLHLDVQGAEYATIPDAIDKLSEKVKSVMIGTHKPAEKHAAMSNLFLEAGWTKRMDYPGGTKSTTTEYGDVDLYDGIVAYNNTKLL